MSSRPKAIAISLAVVALIVCGARLALPYALKKSVNTRLAQMGEYTGEVGDIDVALIRGAYQLHDLVIDKRGAPAEVHFVDLDTADISLRWRALFAGEVVGEIVASGIELNLVQADTETETQLGTGVNWADRVKELFPFQFDRVEANDALVTFRAPGIATDDVLTLSDGHLLLENLSNMREEDRDTFADLEFTGNVMSRAMLTVTGEIDPNEMLPTFDVDMELDETELTDVNPWLERFLKIDAEQGVFSMYAELAAADGRFDGYVKPILEHAKIFGAEEDTESPVRKAWEAIVALAGEIFENQAADQLATQIPLSGEIEDPDAGTLAAIVNLLRNAFVAAFSHSVENTIDLRDVDIDAETGTELDTGEAGKD